MSWHSHASNGYPARHQPQAAPLEEEQHAAVRAVLQGARPNKRVVAEHLADALEHAYARVESERTHLTESLGSPISLLCNELEGSKVPAWVRNTLHLGQRLVEEACELQDRKDVYVAQILAAQRAGWELKRQPLLDLLHRLDSVADRLHQHLPAIRTAVAAMNCSAADSPYADQDGVLVGRVGGRDGEHQSVELLEQVPESLLGPSALRGAEEPLAIIMKGRTNGKTAPGSVTWLCGYAEQGAEVGCIRQTLELIVDLAERLGDALGLVPSAAYSNAAAADRPSPWMAILNKCWHEFRHSARKSLEARDEAMPQPQHAAPPGEATAAAPTPLVEVETLALETHYWAFRGLGAPMRMMCAYVGVDNRDVKYEVQPKPNGGWSSSDWDRTKSSLVDDNPFVQLPCIVNRISGEVVTESNAVYLYLGRLLGLHGSTEKEQLYNEQVLVHVYQMWTELRTLVYPDTRNYKEESDFHKALKPYFEETLPSHYRKLERWLHKLGTGYFAGLRLCTADFHVWELLDQHERLSSRYMHRPPLQGFPALRAFHEELRQSPRLRGYFDGQDFRLPINNKMAFFR